MQGKLSFIMALSEWPLKYGRRCCSQLVYPCGSGGNAEKALGIRIRETFETQGSVLGNFVLKVHGLINTKTGEHPAGTGRSCSDATPR